MCNVMENVFDYVYNFIERMFSFSSKNEEPSIQELIEAKIKNSESIRKTLLSEYTNFVNIAKECYRNNHREDAIYNMHKANIYKAQIRTTEATVLKLYSIKAQSNAVKDTENMKEVLDRFDTELNRNVNEKVVDRIENIVENSNEKMDMIDDINNTIKYMESRSFQDENDEAVICAELERLVSEETNTRTHRVNTVVRNSINKKENDDIFVLPIIKKEERKSDEMDVLVRKRKQPDNVEYTEPDMKMANMMTTMTAAAAMTSEAE